MFQSRLLILSVDTNNMNMKDDENSFIEIRNISYFIQYKEFIHTMGYCFKSDCSE